MRYLALECWALEVLGVGQSARLHHPRAYALAESECRANLALESTDATKAGIRAAHTFADAGDYIAREP